MPDRHHEPGGAVTGPALSMTGNRAARRRAAKAAKKQAKTTPAQRARIVEKHWRDVWQFSDAGLTVTRLPFRRVVAQYPGV